MAGTAFRVEIDDIDVRNGLARLVENAEDLTPAMDAIGAAMVSNTFTRFEQERDPQGTPWAQSIRAALTGGKTLTDRGHLRDSITHLAGPDSVTVGSNLIYAKVHQRGATIHAKTPRGLIFRLPRGTGSNKDEYRRKQSVTIPARPFLGFGPEDQEDAIDALRDHLLGGGR